MVASPGHGLLGPNLLCLVACSVSGDRPNLASRTLRAWLGLNLRFGRSSGARPEPTLRARSVTASPPTGDFSFCMLPWCRAHPTGTQLRHLPSPSHAPVALCPSARVQGRSSVISIHRASTTDLIRALLAWIQSRRRFRSMRCSTCCSLSLPDLARHAPLP